jgi:D-sedoheptulose 7-phosphate isomerase
MADSPFSKAVEAHQEAVRLSFDEEGLARLKTIKDLLVSAIKKGNKVLLCGNGGSAADAQHTAAELVGRFKKERRALPALALTTDTSALTALGNDYGFETVFSRQVEALGSKGDVLIVISTSGNSPNILKAVEAARLKKITPVGFSGGDGGQLRHLVDHCFLARSSETPQIQEVHITALHAVCEAAEEELCSRQ